MNLYTTGWVNSSHPENYPVRIIPDPYHEVLGIPLDHQEAVWALEPGETLEIQDDQAFYYGHRVKILYQWR